MLWTTHDLGHPAATVHQMKPDNFGRPTSPLCGRGTDGLLLLAWTEWEEIPVEHRCARCDGTLLPK